MKFILLALLFPAGYCFGSWHAFWLHRKARKAEEILDRMEE